MVHFILFLVLFLIDQISKIIVQGGNVNLPVIKGFLTFRYVKNEGAAFSFLADKSWAQIFFIALTTVAMIGFFIWYLLANKKKRTLRFALLLIINGALGNLVDRVAFGYVRDFVSFSFFKPIFNIADAVLCIGAALLVIHFLFLDKDALFRKKAKAVDCKDEDMCKRTDCTDAQSSDMTAENTDGLADEQVKTDGNQNG